MPFDKSDERIQEIFENDIEADLEEASGVERNARNFLDVEEGDRFNFLNIRVSRTPFDREEFEKVIETEISSLS